MYRCRSQQQEQSTERRQWGTRSGVKEGDMGLAGTTIACQNHLKCWGKDFGLGDMGKEGFMIWSPCSCLCWTPKQYTYYMLQFEYAHASIRICGSFAAPYCAARRGMEAGSTTMAYMPLPSCKKVGPACREGAAAETFNIWPGKLAPG
jgi:hypothetical protein